MHPTTSKQTANTVSLTSNELDILLHRLSIGDCIAECLMDCDAPKFTSEAIQDRARQLECEATKTHSITITGEIDREIIADCLDGSTYFADIDDEVSLGHMTRQKVNALYKANETLEAKLHAIGIECRNPLC